jgi:hypothetical protein
MAIKVTFKVPQLYIPIIIELCMMKKRNVFENTKIQKQNPVILKTQSLINEEDRRAHLTATVGTVIANTTAGYQGAPGVKTGSCHGITVFESLCGRHTHSQQHSRTA